MKLFKKLAAAVLAAALALTMVGCGGGNSYAMQDELLKIYRREYKRRFAWIRVGKI